MIRCGRFCNHYFGFLMIACGIVIVLYKISSGSSKMSVQFEVDKRLSIVFQQLKNYTNTYCDIFNLKSSEKLLCGRPFESRWKTYLERFGLSDEQIFRMTPSDDEKILHKKPVFVTAFSDNHYHDAIRKVLKTFAEVFPNEKIIVYDLGIAERNTQELQKLSYVKSVRKFNFSIYPVYVGNLFEYRWKPLLLAEMLHDFGAIFYVDAHITFLPGGPSNLSAIMDVLRCDQKPCHLYESHMCGGSDHSVFAATDQRLFEYLPMNSTMSKRTEMGEAGCQFTYYTKDVRATVYKWFVLCALEENCMSPKGNTIYCEFEDRWIKYGNCHRYDQSAISILLANRNNYAYDRFISEFPFKK